jgi:hypothetical protein
MGAKKASQAMPIQPGNDADGSNRRYYTLDYYTAGAGVEVCMRGRPASYQKA